MSPAEKKIVHYVAKTYLIESFRPDFVRVDEFTLMRPESIDVTDEIISAVVENIHSAVERNGGRQSAQTFEDYEWLPQLEIFWNIFLLESIDIFNLLGEGTFSPVRFINVDSLSEWFEMKNLLSMLTTDFIFLSSCRAGDDTLNLRKLRND